MDYIIVWRNRYREPFVDTNPHGFKETYDTYEDAKASAEETLSTENENSQSEWYFDYKIYKEVQS